MNQKQFEICDNCKYVFKNSIMLYCNVDFEEPHKADGKRLIASVEGSSIYFIDSFEIPKKCPFLLEIILKEK